MHGNNKTSKTFLTIAAFVFLFLLFPQTQSLYADSIQHLTKDEVLKYAKHDAQSNGIDVNKYKIFLYKKENLLMVRFWPKQPPNVDYWTIGGDIDYTFEEINNKYKFIKIIKHE